MEYQKSHFQWRWLLELEARTAFVLGVIASLALLIPHKPYVVMVVTYLLVIATSVAAAHQKKIYKQAAADGIEPPKPFLTLCRILVAIEMTVIALCVVIGLWQTRG